MKVKPASGKSTTMYEVDDSALIRNYHLDSASRHYKPFYDFISSLGFDVENEFKKEMAGLESHMMIDGEKFHVDFSNSPYLAKNGWTRETHPRKNRCIELRGSDGYKSGLVAKIKFNEEIDRDKLVSKIQKAIDAKKAWRQEILDRDNNEIKLLTAMRDHYYADRIISAYVESIRAHEGKLHFNINGASITINASSGLPVDFTPYEKRDGVIRISNIAKWACEKKDIAERASKVCEHIVSVGSAGKEFSEYAQKAYNMYVRKDRIEK